MSEKNKKKIYLSGAFDGYFLGAFVVFTVMIERYVKKDFDFVLVIAGYLIIIFYYFSLKKFLTKIGVVV